MGLDPVLISVVRAWSNLSAVGVISSLWSEKQIRNQRKKLCTVHVVVPAVLIGHNFMGFFSKSKTPQDHHENIWFLGPSASAVGATWTEPTSIDSSRRDEPEKTHDG